MIMSRSRRSSSAVGSGVADFYADLEERLAETPFVAGDRFSVADITAAVTVDFATKALSLPIPEAHAASQRWYALVAGRPLTLMGVADGVQGLVVADLARALAARQAAGH